MEITIFLIVCALPFIAMAVWFIYNVCKSASINAKLLSAPSAKSFDISSPRSVRLEKLPQITKPAHEYVLSPKNHKVEEIANIAIEDLLDGFERQVVQAAGEQMTLVRLKRADSALTSMVVVYRASPLTRLVGWLTIEPHGIIYRGALRASEIRWLRTPHDGDSHFDYHHAHEHTLGNTFKGFMGERFMDCLWNILTANILTASTAKEATWFRTFLVQRMDDALTEAYNAQSNPIRPIITPPTVAVVAETAETKSPVPRVRKRPARRD